MNKPCFEVVVIGAGQLGSRYLQGLKRTNLKLSINVVDPDPQSLYAAKQRFDEIESDSLIKSVKYISSIEGIDCDVDLAIIATNADVRREVVEKLLARTDVRYLLLEKVVFQSVSDFQSIISLLSKRNIRAWVSCPRRIIPVFQKIKDDIRCEDVVRFSVTGGDWGLASNTIHCLDLLAFFCGQADFTLNISELDQKVYPLAKVGFIELGGKLMAKTGRGDTLILDDQKDIGKGAVTSFEFGTKKVEIHAISAGGFEGVMRTFEEGNSSPSEKEFTFPFQSEITPGLVERILTKGESGLTPLEESYRLHRPMLEAFNQHISIVLKKPITVCPIT